MRTLVSKSEDYDMYKILMTERFFSFCFSVSCTESHDNVLKELVFCSLRRSILLSRVFPSNWASKLTGTRFFFVKTFLKNRIH